MSPPIGNRAAQEAFAAALHKGALHHAWLLAGPEGIGKARFAEAAALRLLAEAAAPAGLPPGLDVPAGHPTRTLIDGGVHPDLRILRRLLKDPDKPGDYARSITIKQVRDLWGMFATKPALSPRRVVIIDAIDDVERPGASNALLKNLEEPPPGTIFLLVSHAPGRLLPTIRSRTRLLRLEPLTDAQVAEVLSAEMPDASDAERAELVRLAEGSPGRALGFAGLQLGAIDAALETIAHTGDRSNAERLRLARQLAPKTAQARYEAFLDRAPAFLARRAPDLRGPALQAALDAQGEARHLAATARALTLDPQATVFEMAGLVARLAGFESAR
ncbi:DNA polymerase III subunit delta' [Sphingomonas aracearum]|uniref:DNA polymerase III subunit delta n=1 Tax=Sphingomonas aracearum TaxID=2283317 RepID=A0A369VVH3_9SPHN|nr:DNA polymerase III subunit delta' [Sphingomonas aracearum]RDE05062.1 DNA polymerase III subunit delta' [Sphingomonas aracearum]